MHAPADPGFQAFLEQTHDEPVYVILGVQGSGTNFLGRILKRFYGFSLLRDRSAVFNAAARLGRAPTREAIQREIGKFSARAFPSPLRRKVGPILVDYSAFPGVVAELRPEAIRSGADFARLIHAYRAYSLGKRRMAVKSDDLWKTIGAVDEVLPNRRVILITRDFRDNLLSISGKDFGPIDPLCAALYVKERISRYATEYRRAGASGFHVKFETLVTEPRRFFQDFSRHFDLTPVEDPEAAAGSFKIRTNKTEKWRSLPPQELTWCEGILRDEMLEFGYTPESPSRVLPGRSELIAARARDGVLRVPQKIRRTIGRLDR